VARHQGPFRQQSMVAWNDPDFSVRLASVEDLVQVQRDTQHNGWGARWSSEDALVRQVEPGTTAVLCPLFRNGGPEDEPESYRCHIWFVLRSEKDARIVSLVDVGMDMFTTLPEASDPAQLKRVIRVMFEGSPLEAIW
jgi:hypothetical protein